MNLEEKKNFFKLYDLFDFLKISKNLKKNVFLNFEELTKIFTNDNGNCVNFTNGEFDRDNFDGFFTKETKDLMRAVAVLYFS